MHFAAEAGGGFQAEEVVGLIEETLARGEVGSGGGLIFGFGLEGAFGGGGVAILLQRKQALGEARQGIEHAEIFGGVVFELVFAGAGAELTELAADLEEGHFESGERELSGIVIGIGGQAGEGFELRADFVAPDLFMDPVIVAAVVFPFGDIVDGEVAAVFAQGGTDVLIRDTIVEHLVELIADVFR